MIKIKEVPELFLVGHYTVGTFRTTYCNLLDTSGSDFSNKKKTIGW